MINSSSLTAILTHELFHEYLRHNPYLKPSLYGVLGFKQCNDIQLPQWILDRKITSPNPWPNNFYIWIQHDGQRLPCLPVFYSKSTEYTEGVLFDYLVSKLLILEETRNGFLAKCLPSGEPEMLDYNKDTTDFFEQVGHNTKYIIHPEEILADNFSMLVLSLNGPSPQIINRLHQAINMRHIKPTAPFSNSSSFGKSGSGAKSY
jgi:hypothetical protein